MIENTPFRTTVIIGAFIGLVALGSYAPFADAQTATIPGCPYVFTRSLSQGMSGVDVQKLQMLLNSDVATRIAASGVGSPGSETQYFGPGTKNAVVRFQQKYASQVLAPAGLSYGTGFVGGLTRAKLNTLCVVKPSEPTKPTPTKPTPSTRGPEASIEKYKVMNAPSNEDIEENESNAVMAASFKVEDSDVTLSRADVSFKAVGTVRERRPWNLIDTVTLFVDGKEIDTVSVDRESAWNRGSNDVYTLRFSGLSSKLKKGQEHQLTIEVGALPRVDSSDVPQDFNVWFPDRGIRMRDGAGIDQYIGDTDETRDFTVERAGINQELKVRLSNKNPDASVLEVDEKRKSDAKTIAVIELEGKDGAATVSSLPLTVYTFNDGDDAQSFASVVQDLALEINGVKYTDYTAGAGTTEVIDGATTTATVVTFDLERNKLSIGSGKREDMKVVASFRKRDGNYSEGQKVMASMTEANVDAIDAEGARSLGTDKLTGSARGEIQTLRTNGVILASLSTGATRDIAKVGADQGQYMVKVKVTAFDGDFYVPMSTARVDANGAVLSGDSTGGMYFTLESNSGVATDGLASASLSSTAKVVDNAYVVREGQSEEFTLRVAYTPETTSYYQLQLDGIRFRELGEADSAAEFMDAVRQAYYQTDLILLSID